jgi:hypothetical protein
MYGPCVFFKVYVKFKKNSETSFCLLILLHSYRRAIIGSKLNAFYCRIHPTKYPDTCREKKDREPRKEYQNPETECYMERYQRNTLKIYFKY